MQVLNTPQVSFGRNTYLKAEDNVPKEIETVDESSSFDAAKRVSVPVGLLAATLAGLLLTDCQNMSEISLDGKRVSISSNEGLPTNAIQKKVTRDGITLTRNGETRVIKFDEFLKYEKDELRRDLLESYLKSETPELLWHASFEVSKLFYGKEYGVFKRYNETMIAGPRNFAHELAHAMDHHSEGGKFVKFSGSPEFLKVANEEYDAYREATNNNDLNLSIRSTNELWAECAAIQMSRNYKSSNAEALRTHFPRTMAMVKSQMNYLNTLPANRRVNPQYVSNQVREYNPNDELTAIRYYDEKGNCVRVEKKKTSGRICVPGWMKPDAPKWSENPNAVLSK